MVEEYQKIETVYNRSEGGKKLIVGDFRSPVVEYLKDNQWDWVEKVDGTNIRVIWDGHRITFKGRTDKAQIPHDLLNTLQDMFLTDEMEEMFEQVFGEKEVIIFGEGYGNKIQAVGKDYLPDTTSFIAFDILIGGYYLPLGNLFDVCRALGIKAVPVVGTGTLQEAIDFVKTKPKSVLGNCTMEGIVARPTVRIYDGGKRVIVKIKVKDHCED